MRYAALAMIALSACATAQVSSTTTCSPQWNGDVRCETRGPVGAGIPVPMAPAEWGQMTGNIGDSFLRGQQAGASIAVMQQQALQMALQNQMLQQQLMADPNYRRTMSRNYANSVAQECQKGRRHRTQDAQFECMATRYRTDAAFVEGFRYLLDELPPQQAALIESEITARARLQNETAVEKRRTER